MYVTNSFSNPASNKVEISIDEGGLKEGKGKNNITYSVQVLDVSGVVVYNSEEKSNWFTFSRSNLKTGTYVVVVDNGKVRGQKKLIVNH